MYVFEADNASELIYKMLKEVYENGKEYSSRNGNVKEIRPVTAILNNPSNRCIFLPKRKNNIFATIAETAWFFSGKERIDDFLVKFLPRAVDFSDDGITWRGAYGPRLRYWAGASDSPLIDYKRDDIKYRNQIQYVIDILKENDDSRRAFMNIYDPSRDSKSGKDIPCFTGDTLIRSPIGDITFEELWRRSENKKKKHKQLKYPVFSANIETGYIEIKRARNIRKTKQNAKVMKINFDDGSSLTCTDTHKFYIRNKKRIMQVEAGMMRPGYSVIPIHIIQDGKGYFHFINNFKTNSSYRNKYKVHRAVVEFYEDRKLPADIVVHHRDENKGNNTRKNLKALTHEEHNILERGVYNPKDKSMFSNNDLVEIGVESINKFGKLTRDGFNKTADKLGKDVKYFTVRKRFKSFSNFKSVVDEKITNNHRVISVETVKQRCDVYNMTVDDNHNYFVGSGILVGNCNTSLDFKLRDNKLDLLVNNRSNDIIWGFSGVNLFIFTFLQEVIANTLGVELGKYYHVSNSMHLYENMYKRAEFILKNYSIFVSHFYHENCFEGVSDIGNYNEVLGDSERAIKIYNDYDYTTRLALIPGTILCYMLFERIMLIYESYNNNSNNDHVMTYIDILLNHLEYVPFDIRMCALNYLLRQVKKDDDFFNNFVARIGIKWPHYVVEQEPYEYIFRG